jgi:hypothetical protein
MRPIPVIRVLLCLFIAACSTASAQTQPLFANAPANAMVGLWEVRGSVGSCDSSVPLPPPMVATLMFQAGGSLVETNTMPSAGVPTPFGLRGRNGPRLGNWTCEPRHRRFHARFRFNWWMNRLYDGYQKIERQEIHVSREGRRLRLDDPGRALSLPPPQPIATSAWGNSAASPTASGSEGHRLNERALARAGFNCRLLACNFRPPRCCGAAPGLSIEAKEIRHEPAQSARARRGRCFKRNRGQAP